MWDEEIVIKRGEVFIGLEVNDRSVNTEDADKYVVIGRCRSSPSNVVVAGFRLSRKRVRIFIDDRRIQGGIDTVVVGKVGRNEEVLIIDHPLEIIRGSDGES